MRAPFKAWDIWQKGLHICASHGILLYELLRTFRRGSVTVLSMEGSFEPETSEKTVSRRDGRVVYGGCLENS